MVVCHVKNKWFQIIGSITQLLVIPIGYIFFRMGLPAYTIIILYIMSTIIGAVICLYLMKRILNFDIIRYVKHVFVPSFRVIIMIVLLAILYLQWDVDTVFKHIVGLIFGFLMTVWAIYLLGLELSEKELLKRMITEKIIINHK